MTPLPIYRSTLTGATRGRPRLFSRTLILQVEVVVESIGAFDALEHQPRPGAGKTEAQMLAWRDGERDRIAASWQPVRTEWRDATWEDQLMLAAPLCQPAALRRAA